MKADEVHIDHKSQSLITQKLKMNQYTFTSKHRLSLYIAMAVGLLSMIFTWLNDDVYHTRFWTNLLHTILYSL